MSSNCNCIKMPSVFYYEDTEKDFYEGLEKIDSFDWYELYECKMCFQYWRIDIWDKLQERFVVRVENRNNWKDFDETPLIKELIIKNRGGTIDQECVWQSCKGKRVNAQ